MIYFWLLLRAKMLGKRCYIGINNEPPLEQSYETGKRLWLHVDVIHDKTWCYTKYYNTYFTIPKVIFKFCHFSSQMQLPRIFFLLQAMRYARMRANIYFRANKEIVTELILIKINSSLFVHKKLSKFLPRATWCLDIVM